MTRRQILARVLALVVTLGIPAAYVATSREAGVPVDEVRAAVIEGLTDSGVTIRSLGVDRDTAEQILAEATKVNPEARGALQAVVDAAYSRTARSDRARYSAEVGLLASAAAVEAANAALARAYCAPLLRPTPDGGGITEYDTCAAANSAWLSVPHCDGRGTVTHRSARLRVTPGHLALLAQAAAAVPGLTLVDGADDETWAAALSRARLVACPQEAPR